MKETLAALIAIVGAENVRTDEESRLRALASWNPVQIKRRGGGVSSVAAVVAPSDTEEVAAILRLASQIRTRVHIMGGGSNVTGNGTHRGDDGGDIDAFPIALDLSRLNSVTWDEESLLVTAGAGVLLASLEEQLGSHGYTLGHLPRSVRLATVGGSAATNAIGLLSGRYGRQSDLTVSIEAVLPEGEILRTSSAPGANAAFDLHSLFIGAEGRFGVITSVTFRMQPAPEVRAWVAFAFDSLNDAIDAMRLICRSDSDPAVLRVFDTEAASTIYPAPERGALLLMGFEGEEIRQAGNYQLAYAVCQQIGGMSIPESPTSPGDEWFERREETSAWSANGRPGGIADVFAFGATWSQLKHIEAAVRAAMSPLTTSLALEIAHPTTEGAALEWRWEAQAEPPTTTDSIDLYNRIAESAYSACLHEGGIIAHHFGIGEARRNAFAMERGTTAMKVLQVIKAGLDPAGILNPL
jgi:alkyldihydroxyacetonephosphate synthase